MRGRVGLARKYAKAIQFGDPPPPQVHAGGGRVPVGVRNDRENVIQHVNDALAADSVSEKVDILTELNGVQVRMASAILLFVNPDRFTVLDWRASTRSRAARSMPANRVP